MGEVVSFNAAAQLVNDHGFLVDFARYSEGILDEKFLRRKYKQFNNAVWDSLGSDEKLLEAIEETRLMRQRNGDTKRELAQKHIVKGPAILESIMSDDKASPRHRVDAIKVLDAIASPPQQQAGPDSSRFIISIFLGTDATGNEVVEHFNKSIAITPDDEAPAIIAADTKDNGSGDDI
jgi:hypothetical protein